MILIDRNNFDFEFLVETLDDLWVLSQVINPQDKLYGTTERKVKIGSETNYKIVKKLIFVELLVRQVKFENEVLRVTGEIQNETEFTAKGASHTLKFGLGDKLKITKKELLKFEDKLINNAINSKKSHNLLVLLDKDTIVVSEFSNFSYKVIFTQSGLGSKKYHITDVNEEEEKLKLIESLLGKDYNNIIFAGIGIYKDKFAKYVKDKLGLKILTFSYPDVRSQVIPKVIKNISESGVLEDSQITYENKFMQEFLANLNKKEKYAYGEDDVKNAINSGSVEVFMITTEFMAEKKEKDEYLETSNLMKLVEQLNGNLVIIDSSRENGTILDGLGGIGAILRY